MCATRAAALRYACDARRRTVRANTVAAAARISLWAWAWSPWRMQASCRLAVRWAALRTQACVVCRWPGRSGTRSSCRLLRCHTTRASCASTPWRWRPWSGGRYSRCGRGVAEVFAFKRCCVAHRRCMCGAATLQWRLCARCAVLPAFCAAQRLQAVGDDMRSDSARTIDRVLH